MAIATVGTIMTRHVVSVSMDDSVRRVRDIFQSVRFHHLIVMEHGRVVGVISDRDLLKHISPFVGKVTERREDLATLDKRVHQVMSRRLVFCSPETPVGDAGTLMIANQVSCLPVLDDRQICVGILTVHDLLNWCLIRCAGNADSCTLPQAA